MLPFCRWFSYHALLFSVNKLFLILKKCLRFICYHFAATGIFLIIKWFLAAFHNASCDGITPHCEGSNSSTRSISSAIPSCVLTSVVSFIRTFALCQEWVGSERREEGSSSFWVGTLAPASSWILCFPVSFTPFSSAFLLPTPGALIHASLLSAWRMWLWGQRGVACLMLRYQYHANKMHFYATWTTTNSI